jgi:uncharacterized protein (TIGR03000 family)
MIRAALLSLASVALLNLEPAQAAAPAVGKVAVPAKAKGATQFNFQNNLLSDLVVPDAKTSAYPFLRVRRFDLETGELGGFVSPGYRGPGYPFFGIWGGYGGSGSPYSYGSGSSYSPNTSSMISRQAPRYVPPVRTAAQMAQANAYPAVLTVQLPAAGEVWLNGRKSDGKPTEEWTLKSPVLEVGQRFEFEVRARWEANGKALEYQRTLALDGGNRSRIVVVGGSEVSSSESSGQ